MVNAFNPIKIVKPFYDILFLNKYAKELNIAPAASRLSSLIIGRVFNYTQFYKEFDPQKYYVFVGSPTEKDFIENGNIVFNHLKQNGLTTSSYILDVGCGTGRVTRPLYSFLSDNGKYVGIDLGKEAIDFCKQRYINRKNFSFITTDGKTIPLTTQPYDFMLFMSVFTHLFEPEMIELLNTCKPKLSQKGKIVASFWFSGDPGAMSNTKTKEGNRQRMEYNRQYLYSLLSNNGWQLEEQDWDIGQKVLILTK
jgi:SAM-dependent methyltransferase